MSRIGKLFDKLYDWAFETVPVNPQPMKNEQDDKFYLPCNVLFGQYKQQRENERRNQND